MRLSVKDFKKSYIHVPNDHRGGIYKYYWFTTIVESQEKRRKQTRQCQGEEYFLFLPALFLPPQWGKE
jgi:hypothetical protein